MRMETAEERMMEIKVNPESKVKAIIKLNGAAIDSPRVDRVRPFGKRVRCELLRI